MTGAWVGKFFGMKMHRQMHRQMYRQTRRQIYRQLRRQIYRQMRCHTHCQVAMQTTANIKDLALSAFHIAGNPWNTPIPTHCQYDLTF